MHKEYRILFGIPSAILILLVVMITLDATKPQTVVEASLVPIQAKEPNQAYLPLVADGRWATPKDTLLLYAECATEMPPPPYPLFSEPFPCMLIEAQAVWRDVILYQGVLYEVYYQYPGDGGEWLDLVDGEPVTLYLNQSTIEDLAYEVYGASPTQGWCHIHEPYCWYPHSLQVLPASFYSNS